MGSSSVDNIKALLTVPQGVMRICHSSEGIGQILIMSLGTVYKAFIVAPKRKLTSGYFNDHLLQ